jgi:Spy/CpxP family protein refolding chaperone
MRSLTRWSQVALAVLVLAVALPALSAERAPLGAPSEAKGADNPLGADEWWTNPRVAERLNLTAEQQKRIGDLAFQSGQKMIDLRADLQKARLGLTHLLGAEALDDAAIDKTVDQLQNAECGLQRARIRLRVDIARVLDRDQRLALRDIVRERFAGVRERLRQRSR